MIKRFASKIVLSIALVIIFIDWTLPSNITLFFDEVLMYACVWAALKVR